MGVESPQSDADLLRAVKEGIAAAYGQLYERHVAAARALARQLVRGTEADDVVAEAFTKILDLVGRGKGPDAAFRTYLLTVVRRTVHDRSRIESRQVATGEIEEYDPGVPFVDPALVGLEKSLIARAYLSLPERWRAVLWHTEVEKSRPAGVAPLLGLSVNGVAALAYRAREGLRQAYLQIHLGEQPQHECRPVLGKMGAYVRGGLARRDSKAVDEHVNGCEECHGVLLELTDVNRGLRVMVGPLIAGPLFGGYAAALAKSATGGGAGRLLRVAGRLRRAPRHQQAAIAGGAAVAVAALLLISEEGPATKRPATAPIAQPPASVRPAQPQPQPSEVPVRVPPPVKTAKPLDSARLRATIEPLGALVRAQPGIVRIRLRNYGDAPSEELAALVDLPPGVALIPTARHHQTARPGPVGTVDGWACRPVGGGARCAREPLGAGQGTAVFLRVLVAGEAPEGAGPAVRVEAGSLRVRARAEEGVRATGAPARFATEGRVTVRAIGNALLSCPEERVGCPQARRRQGDQRDNDLWPMAALDRDDVPDTAASSAARLSLPKSSRVVWAGLYWSASGERAGPIKIRPPGRRKYETVRPGHVAVRELPAGPVYQAFADVSGLVAGVRRNGMWWAADAPLEEGVARHAGWSLVLIVSDPAEPYSQAVVLDTATVVGGADRRVRIPIGGLTPAAAPARVELVTWEGDADLEGDKVSLGTGALTPVGGGRHRANVFDGSSSGVAEMTFGADIDTVGAELGADPGLTIATDKDVVLFGVAALSVRARS
ncbi:sigma-70 family RNA polymerase sigma factor [Nonomuraea basaltis]|uniref:sigma-70 family RNA polymerase sigma factor n=1 Tax=Nonomuraea basaltis TaxID=2495887 RepID=UPI00110C66D4|nr:sigma-70 family RNA polymerase sigma factor [Nonomuraea basaltis]TMS00036.1 sigma-70 family RNA polymerase sigma factor [Nonomuraea basaltis]